jgi:hypothetical protein
VGRRAYKSGQNWVDTTRLADVCSEFAERKLAVRPVDPFVVMEKFSSADGLVSESQAARCDP